MALMEHDFTSERYLTNKAGGSMFSPSIRHCSGPKMPGGIIQIYLVDTHGKFVVYWAQIWVRY